MSMGFKADPEKGKEKVAQVMEQLENGVNAMKDSEGWKRYLDVQSRFHRYSFSNTMLILVQRPDATRVTGYQTWLKMKRQVRKGEKGIFILAPVPYERVETDENGKEQNVKGIWFKAVSVFDIGQTEGEDLPSAVQILQGDSMAVLIEKLVKFSENVNNCPVTFEKYDKPSNGYYEHEPSHRIVVKSSNPTNQQVKTLIHEIGHSMIHKKSLGRTDINQEEMELEAESVAYVVCSILGYDTSDYSFGYLAGWSHKQDFSKVLKKIGDTVQKTAMAIIDGISDKKGKASEATEQVA